jgi:uncharacterized glyoxalase superfamily protein PhnB
MTEQQPNRLAITPMLVYEDPEAAIQWLAAAFGFEIGLILRDGDGKINHSELHLGDALIMAGPPYDLMNSASPRALGDRITAQFYVYVDDVDAHHERARAAGARIIAGPADQGYGDRTYRVVDLEGQRWIFAQPIRRGV